MEQVPQDNEHDEQQQPQPDRPVFSVDLSGDTCGPLDLIYQTQTLLEGDALVRFNQAVQEASTPGANKDYNDLLEIIDAHVELVDTGNVYQQYAWQGKITGAVQWLNEQIETLPESVPCGIDGLYPDFDDPDTGPEAYLDVLWEEMARAEQSISEYDGEQREQLEHYRDLLMTAIARFFRYGLL